MIHHIVYILFFTKKGTFNKLFKIMLCVFMLTHSSLCVGRERATARGRKGGMELLFKIERRPLAFLWSSSAGSTQSLSHRKYMISVWVLIHTERKQLKILNIYWFDCGMSQHSPLPLPHLPVPVSLPLFLQFNDM